MEIEYNLSIEDTFTSALFVTSQSPVVKKRRRREQYIYPAVYLALLGTLFYINNSLKGILITIIITSLWISFYPYLSKFAIKRKFFKNSGKRTKTGIQTTVKLKTGKEDLTLSDPSGESKISASEIDKIIEIKNYFLIRMNSNAHLIIPKNQLNADTLDSFINQIRKLTKADIINMTDWKWS